jgi:hypothetical protein
MSGFTSSDTTKIAQTVSEYAGSHFGAENLVNYGQTIIVKPGARTACGRLISGAHVATALGGDYNVFPLAVSYGSDDSDLSPEAFEQDINALLSEAESDAEAGDDGSEVDEQMGARPARISRRSVRLRRRYSRIAKRFGKFAAKAGASKRKRPRRVAARAFKRIQKLWAKMQRKGIPTAGLPSPEEIKARVGKASAEIRSKGADPFDQAALEREVGLSMTSSLLKSQIAQTAFGAERDLHSDVRAETLGYLFGEEEHDYFGVLDGPFEISVSMGEEIEDEIDDELEADDLEDDDLEDDDLEDDDLEDDDLDDLDAELDELESATDTVKRVGPKVVEAARVVDDVARELKSLVSVPVSGRHASQISKARTRVNERLRRSGPAESSAESVVALTAKIEQLQAKLRELDDALKNDSEMGAVDYGAIVPSGPRDHRKITVVAIRKPRRVRRHLRPLPPRPYAFGVDVVQEAVARGYSPAEALHALSDATDPADFMGDALEVFGAYVEGFNAEAEEDEVRVMGEFGRAPRPARRPPARRAPPRPPAARVRRPAPARGLTAQYRALLARFRQARAARDERLAANLLGRIRFLWARLTGKQRRDLPPPSRLKVPKVELAKAKSRAAAATELKIRRAAARVRALSQAEMFDLRGFTPRPRVSPALVHREMLKQARPRRGAAFGGSGAFPIGYGAPFPGPRSAGEEVF